MQSLVTQKTGKVPVSTYFLILAAVAMLMPVFPLTAVSAAAVRGRVDPRLAAVGITLLSLQTGGFEQDMVVVPQ